MTNRSIILVDAFGIGKYFIPQLKQHNLQPVHVQSRTDVPEFRLRNFKPEEYIATLIYQNNLAEFVSQLKPYNCQFLINVGEMGIETGDLLAAKLGLPGNTTKLSHARRNKYHMIETIKKNGLLTAQQYKTDNATDLIAWRRQLGNWPIIIKPLASAGNDKVFYCTNDSEIINAVNQIIGSKNILLLDNHEVLAQSYLDGEEYAVNTVSYQGHHMVTDIWLYDKKFVNHSCIQYANKRVISSDHQHYQQLAAYVNRVLDALDIKYGAGHSEIKMTSKGPALVEIGARPSGYVNFNAAAVATGRSQVYSTIHSYLEPKQFIQESKMPYNLHKHLLVKYIHAYKTGTLKQTNHLDTIKNLRSYYDIIMRYQDGEQIIETSNLLSCAGYLTLMHEDPTVVEQDYQTVMRLERGMLDIS